MPYEMDLIRASQAELAGQYSGAFLSSPAHAKLIRNEIIAQRMYAIDVQYTLYENALTRETQEVGFGALTAAEGLSTAATLVAPAATKTILSAAATGVLAVKGHYDSEVLLAQSMRTIQKQMRASRNLIAANISAKLVQGVTEYPLSAALSDLEEYYAAGTLTTGIIDTSTTVGIREADSKALKQDVTQATPALRAAILRNAVIEDATVPIAKPTRLGVIFSQGLTDFERRGLTPAILRQMQSVVCLPETGIMTSALRARVLKRVGKNADLATEVTDGIPITMRDAQKMTNEFNAIKNGPPQPNRCS